jgi:SAM-dependent methyltransferase
MREIVCPVCNGAERTLVFPTSLPADFDEAAPPSPYSAHYQVNACIGCGLKYSSPIMDDPGVASLYRNSSETNVAPGEEDNVRRTMANYYDLAAPHLPGRTRVLDVGCDMGFLLEAARRDGFEELHGIEPNPAARCVASRIEGAMIADGFYERTEYPAGSFDLISLVHVLDHLVDPRITLSHALKHLRPGGILVAVVHNVDSLLGRLLGERCPIFNLYHHYFFNKATLAQLFQRQGFDVIDVVRTYNCYSLGFFTGRLPALPERIRDGALRVLGATGLKTRSVTIPVGNIGIVARRPMS